MTEWHCRINGKGPELYFRTASSKYHAGVMAAMQYVDDADMSDPVEIEIWVPKLLPDYGPYRYVVWEDEFGSHRVSAARKPD